MLGWKYVEANEETQKYKVGKFILETKKIRIGVSWENDDEPDNEMDQFFNCNTSSRRSTRKPPPDPGEETLEFDSQDEDECEDLFAGVWSPQLAAKRRARKNLRFGNRGREGNLRARLASPSTGRGASRTRSEEILS